MITAKEARERYDLIAALNAIEFLIIDACDNGRGYITINSITKTTHDKLIELGYDVKHDPYTHKIDIFW
jgi:hypothetical protein